MFYDPENPPDPAEWLALDESERIRLAQNYHVKSRVKLPNVKAHAAFHAIVENQVAEDFGPTVHALDRLQREGLSRHDAVHAVGWVLAQHIFEGQRNRGQLADPAEMQRRLSDAIEQLSAESWRRQERDG